MNKELFKDLIDSLKEAEQFATTGEMHPDAILHTFESEIIDGVTLIHHYENGVLHDTRKEKENGKD